MNNFPTALLQFEQALKICRSDPLIFNEIGVTHYKQGNYEQALESLVQALSLCRDSNSATYESILLNMGHCYRKQKDFFKAIEIYERCLTINPGQASTLSAIGFAHH